MGLPMKTPAEARVAPARGPPAHVTFAACCLVRLLGLSNSLPLLQLA